MGVLMCNRNGCDNVMCDVTVEGTWYICSNCIEEFLNKKGRKFESKGKFLKKFEKFINSNKKYYSSEDFLFDAEDYFQQNNRWNDE